VETRSDLPQNTASTNPGSAPGWKSPRGAIALALIWSAAAAQTCPEIHRAHHIGFFFQNSFSLESRPLTPGGLVTVSLDGLGPQGGLRAEPDAAGNLPTMLPNGTFVCVDEIPAPLLYVDDARIEFQVPYRIQGRGVVTVKFLNPSQDPLRTGFPFKSEYVVGSAPGLEPLDTDRTRVRALHADGELVSAGRPARAGTPVTFFATGFGSVTAPEPAGRPSVEPYATPILPVSLEVGGLKARVVSATTGSGRAGVLRVSAVLPEYLPAALRASRWGPSVDLPVRLAIGDAWSQEDLMLPVERTDPDVSLDDWLRQRPVVAAAIVWQQPDLKLVNYTSWSREQKQDLAAAVSARLDGWWTQIPDPPELLVMPDVVYYRSSVTTLAEKTAWQVFVAHVAQSIAVDAARLVPWTLEELSPSELYFLFDSRSLFEFGPDANMVTAAWNSYHINGMSVQGKVTPGDPAFVFDFLLRRNLIAQSRLETIHRVLDWSRRNLVHEAGPEIRNTSLDWGQQLWRYSGCPPVRRIIEGTANCSDSQGLFAHWTGGCQGTTGFLRALLRTANIPVEFVNICGAHASPHFVHEGLYLSHADDLYFSGCGVPEDVPVSELLIDGLTFERWFGSSVPIDERCANIGRQVWRVALERLTTPVLNLRCGDIANRRPIEESSVWAICRRWYSMQDLLDAGLWERLDAKIQPLGLCDSAGALSCVFYPGTDWWSPSLRRPEACAQLPGADPGRQ
jgi:uncharacterized protein (TIGR03437 family)